MDDDAPIALLTVIRHAQSRANVEHVLQGVTDAPLSAEGEAQLVKLEEAWRATDAARNLYDLPTPHLVVASPIGRARKTAAAVVRGLGMEVTDVGDTTFRSPKAEVPDTTRHTHLVYDSGLSERNFGAAECTAKGKRVSDYERPPASFIGRADSNKSFHDRVKSASSKWLDWLVAVAQREGLARDVPCTQDVDSREATPDECAAVALASEPRAVEAIEAHALPKEELPRAAQHGAVPLDADAPPPDKRPLPTEATRDVPHLVLVSHGQWIHTFLRHAIPELRNTFYVKSNNTALFTLGVHLNDDGTPRLSLLRQNDTAHLGAARPKKAKAQQRTTLDALWHA